MLFHYREGRMAQGCVGWPSAYQWHRSRCVGHLKTAEALPAGRNTIPVKHPRLKDNYSRHKQNEKTLRGLHRWHVTDKRAWLRRGSCRRCRKFERQVFICIRCLVPVVWILFRADASTWYVHMARVQSTADPRRCFLLICPSQISVRSDDRIRSYQM